MLHLIKLSVGPDNLDDLKFRYDQRIKDAKANGQKPELIHVTRRRPKREAEILPGGSLFWVIKGYIVARQKLVEFRTIQRNDLTYCGLVFDRKLIPVQQRAHRAFQGWRYFDPQEAPRDLSRREIDDDLPEKLRREIAEFGVL